MPIYAPLFHMAIGFGLAGGFYVADKYLGKSPAPVKLVAATALTWPIAMCWTVPVTILHDVLGCLTFHKSILRSIRRLYFGFESQTCVPRMFKFSVWAHVLLRISARVR